MRPQDFLENANGDIVTATAKWLCYAKGIQQGYSEEQKELHLLSVMSDPCNDFRTQAYHVLKEMSSLLSEHEADIRQADFVLSKDSIVASLVAEPHV